MKKEILVLDGPGLRDPQLCALGMPADISRRLSAVKRHAGAAGRACGGGGGTMPRHPIVACGATPC